MLPRGFAKAMLAKLSNEDCLDLCLDFLEYKGLELHHLVEHANKRAAKNVVQ